MPSRLTARGVLALIGVGAQGASVAMDHWRKLTPDEKSRLRELALKFRGRPSNLSSRERAELRRILGKLELGKLGPRLVALRPGARGRGGRR